MPKTIDGIEYPTHYEAPECIEGINIQAALWTKHNAEILHELYETTRDDKIREYIYIWFYVYNSTPTHELDQINAEQEEEWMSQ